MNPTTWFLGGLVWLAGAQLAAADVVRLELPGLLGDYAINGFTGAGTLRGQAFTPWPPTAPEGVELVLVGTVTPAVLRGDGVIVPAGDVPLSGILAPDLTSGDMGQHVTDLPPLAGGFEMHVGFQPPFYLTVPEPAPDAPPWCFDPRLDVQMGADYWDSHLPARFVPPGPNEVTDVFDGFTMISPMTAHVTEAYLLVSGATIPEPAALSALVLGGLALLRRRRA